MRPGSGEVADRIPAGVSGRRARYLPGLAASLERGASIPLAVSLAAGLLALWLIAEPRTPDLAAATYRLGLFRQVGFALWDEHWYAGHDLPGYSLMFSPLASLLGLRLLAVTCVLASAMLFERIARAAYGPAARWGACFFALAAVGDAWAGRLAFALGVCLALGAVLALMRAHGIWAGVLAALCAAASPVAGVLLALAGVTHALSARRARSALALAAPVAVVLLPLALLFPEGGFEPYPFWSFAATVLVIGTFLWAVRAGQPLLRFGGAVYLLACVLCLLVHTPMGSNVERYGVLLAGPLLLCAVLAAPAGAGGARRRPAWGGEGVVGRGVVALALCLAAVWVVWGPVRETLAVANSPSTSASYYRPVEQFLAERSKAPVRVEVPLTRSHWEAALLAPAVSLARGWEKQLEVRFDHVLLARGLTAGAYRRWLDEQAVTYVALPDAPLDPSSAQEGALIRRGLGYLRLVFSSRHWRIYAVLSPAPLLAGPGRLASLGDDSFTLDAYAPGSFLVRVHYSPYLTLTRGEGCVGPAPDGWTRVVARSAGAVRIAARFSLARALGLGGACRAGPSA